MVERQAWTAADPIVVHVRTAQHAGTPSIARVFRVRPMKVNFDVQRAPAMTTSPTARRVMSTVVVPIASRARMARPVLITTIVPPANASVKHACRVKTTCATGRKPTSIVAVTSVPPVMPTLDASAQLTARADAAEMGCVPLRVALMVFLTVAKVILTVAAAPRSKISQSARSTPVSCSPMGR